MNPLRGERPYTLRPNGIRSYGDPPRGGRPYGGVGTPVPQGSAAR